MLKDSDVYQQVLGLQSPWRVAQVELDQAAQRVVVHVGVERGTKRGDPATREAAAREGRQIRKGSKYLWLRNFPDLCLQPSFRQLYRLNLRTGRAWRLKETFGGFWHYCY